jgi:N-acetylglutamate synthase-like GNAT family acetyltransferase
MKHQFTEYFDPIKKTQLCKKVLDDLPLWFGIEESKKEYCDEVKKYRFIAILFENKEIGFVSLKQNSEKVIELYVLGILKEYHRQGIGSEILAFIENDLKNKGIEYLEVKTIGEPHKSVEYGKTRAFYYKNGFIKLDVLQNEWGEKNPCLVLIKRI